MSDFGFGPIGQIGRSVRDLKQAERWYGETLGLQHLYTFGNLAFFDCDGTRLTLSHGDANTGSNSILQFRVNDMGRAQAWPADRGVELTQPPRMIHRHADGAEKRMTFCKDPESRPPAAMSQSKS